MKTEPNDLITPVQCTEYAPGFFNALTKREFFASQALVGLCVQAIPGNHNTLSNPVHSGTLAKYAVIMADALILELNKADGK